MNFNTFNIKFKLIFSPPFILILGFVFLLSFFFHISEMVLFLSQPDLCEGVFQGMLQGILEERKAKRPYKPHGSEWKRIKILACRNCRTPFSSTSTHPIQKVMSLHSFTFLVFIFFAIYDLFYYIFR